MVFFIVVAILYQSSLYHITQLLLAKRTRLLLGQPLLDALAVEHVLALQQVNLLPLLHVVVADRTQLLLMGFRGCHALQPIQLLLVESLGDLAHLFFKLEELLVGHVVDVDVHAALIAQVEHHLSHLLEVHHLVLLVWIWGGVLLAASSWMA